MGGICRKQESFERFIRFKRLWAIFYVLHDESSKTLIFLHDDFAFDRLKHRSFQAVFRPYGADNKD